MVLVDFFQTALENTTIHANMPHRGQTNRGGRRGPHNRGLGSKHSHLPSDATGKHLQSQPLRKSNESQLTPPEPRFKVGDTVSNVKVRREHREKPPDSSPGSSAWGRSSTPTISFIVESCHDDKKYKDWGYLGRLGKNKKGEPVGEESVWAWEWEIVKPRFKIDQQVQIICGGETVGAEISRSICRRDGVFYDLDLGVTELPVSQLKAREVTGLYSTYTTYEVDALGRQLRGGILWKREKDGTRICVFEIKLSEIRETDTTAWMTGHGSIPTRMQAERGHYANTT